MFTMFIYVCYTWRYAMPVLIKVCLGRQGHRCHNPLCTWSGWNFSQVGCQFGGSLFSSVESFVLLMTRKTVWIKLSAMERKWLACVRLYGMVSASYHTFLHKWWLHVFLFEWWQPAEGRGSSILAELGPLSFWLLHLTWGVPTNNLRYILMSTTVRWSFCKIGKQNSRFFFWWGHCLLEVHSASCILTGRPDLSGGWALSWTYGGEIILTIFRAFYIAVKFPLRLARKVCFNS